MAETVTASLWCSGLSIDSNRVLITITHTIHSCLAQLHVSWTATPRTHWTGDKYPKKLLNTVLMLTFEEHTHTRQNIDLLNYLSVPMQSQTRGRDEVRLQTHKGHSSHSQNLNVQEHVYFLPSPSFLTFVATRRR